MAAPEEIWKNINSNYKISSFGRVKSVDRVIKTKNGNRFYKGKILSNKGEINGYPVVNIKGKAIKVHQLVAVAFLNYKKNNSLVVNHINGDKKDNRISNLEVITQSENIKHAFEIGIRKPVKNYGYKNGFSKKVLNIKSKKSYGSLKEVFREDKDINFTYSALRAMLNGQNPNKSNYKYI